MIGHYRWQRFLAKSTLRAHWLRTHAGTMNNRGLPGKLALVGIGGCLLLAIASPQLIRAQSSDVADWEKAAGGKMSFAVASVKINKSGPPPHSNVPLGSADLYPANGGLFSATDWAVSFYIAFAYKLSPPQFDSLGSQLPKWAQTERFDVEARADGSPAKDQMRLMMQSLLVDRFKLRIHNETHQLPVYAVVLAKPGKAGPQLRPFPDGTPCSTDAPAATSGRGGGAGPSAPAITGGFPSACGTLVIMTQAGGTVPLLKLGARNVPIGFIVKRLEQVGGLDRPLIDGTGLGGTFDFTFQWRPTDTPAQPAAVPNPDDSGPTFLERLKDQLGLKLESINAPMQSLVIDHIEQPTSN
jgi:uncharacterized protein (TIGR03435 family)